MDEFREKEGIVVVGEIQKREIMPLTLELIGAAGKLSKEEIFHCQLFYQDVGSKKRQRSFTITELMKSSVSKMKN